jgi:hypothetical protein
MKKTLRQQFSKETGMQLIRRLTGGLALLCLAALLASCIAIYPGAFPQLTPTPAARANSANTFDSDLADAVSGRSNNVLQPAIEGSSDAATLYGGVMNPGVLPTDVRQVLILRQTGIFEAPRDFIQMGTTVPGQEYAVLGASPDGQWWQVDCLPDFDSCWISANPVFVQPLIGLQPSVAATPAPVCLPATSDGQQNMERPVERITFAPGQSSAFADGLLEADVLKHYVVSAVAGQQLRLLLVSTPAGSANFAVNGVSDGVVYKPISDPAREALIAVPVTQDYLITLFSPVAAEYQLEVTIPTPLPPTPMPLPTLFPPVQSIPSARELQICCDNKDKMGTEWCCNILSGR